MPIITTTSKNAKKSLATTKLLLEQIKPSRQFIFLDHYFHHNDKENLVRQYYRPKFVPEQQFLKIYVVFFNRVESFSITTGDMSSLFYLVFLACSFGNEYTLSCNSRKNHQHQTGILLLLCCVVFDNYSISQNQPETRQGINDDNTTHTPNLF